MPPLHPLENEVVAGLQRQMQMRHQAPLARQSVEQFGVGFYRVNRRQAQARDLLHLAQDAFDQRTQPPFAVAVTGDIDAGEHDLAIAALGKRTHLRHDIIHWQRARIAAAKWNDAEGTTVVAAVLHLHESARMAREHVDAMRRHGARRHDVADSNTRAFRPRPRIELFLVAQDAVDFGHGGKGFRIGLRRAAGDDDLPLRLFTPDAANRLPRLAHGFRGHRAGVDHNSIAVAGHSFDDFRLDDIEPAAEGDNLNRHGATAFSNNAESNLPANSNSTGPVINTWPSLSRQSTVNSPPGSVIFTFRLARLSRAAATAAAQAAEPQALVKPAPRSQVRIMMCSREAICARVILARSGKIG